MEEQNGLRLTCGKTNFSSQSTTPYESAASSPRNSASIGNSYFCAGTSVNSVEDCDKVDSSSKVDSTHEAPSSLNQLEPDGSEEFDFSRRFLDAEQTWSATSMSCADELFLNGQIRPLWYTADDLISWHSACSEHGDDEGDHYEFQSSADYNFRMLSMSIPHGSNVCNQEHQLGYEYRIGDTDHNKMDLMNHAIYLRSEQDAEEGDEMRKTWWTFQGEVSKRRPEENRGRRARLARSLSPPRVFHMDDDLPRRHQAGSSFQTSNEKMEMADRDEKWGGGNERTRKKGTRMTLKDLLAWEKADFRSFSRRQMSVGSTEHDIPQTGMQPARNIIIMKSMKKAYSQNEIQSQTSHGVGHKPPVSESGHMGDEGFMPYKHGLLSCLGLTSNNYRSIACFHCVQSRRRGMR